MSGSKDPTSRSGVVLDDRDEPPSLSIIIVNWNTCRETLQCLESLQRDETMIDQVVVIDNGSVDDSVSQIRTQFPDATLVVSDRNEGFARAVNRGIVETRSRYILLLNSDARVEEGALGTITTYLDAHPDVGIVGAQLLNEDASPQHSSSFVPGLASELLNRSLLQRIRPSDYGKPQTDQGPIEVPTVIGAALAIRRDVVDKVGFLDEDYFVFLEETDWCVRAREAGYRVMLHPEARVTHLQGHSRKAALTRSRIEYLRSLYTFMRKHNGRLGYLFFCLLRPLKQIVSSVLSTVGVLLTLGLHGKTRQRSVSHWTQLLWLFSGRPSTWGLLPRVPRAEPSPLQHKGEAWYLDRDQISPEQLSGVLEARSEGDLLKSAGRKHVWDLRHDNIDWIVKLVEDPSAVRQIGNRIVGRKPIREFMTAATVDQVGIHVASAAAAGDGENGAILITRKLEGAVVLEAYLQRTVDIPPDQMGFRKRVLEEYGRYAARVHKAGVLQDDFNPTNVLLTFEGGRPFLRMIDFERVKMHRRLSDRQRWWNLAKADRYRGILSRVERLRVLKGYLDVLPGGRRALRDAIRELNAISVEIRMRDAHKIRRRCTEVNRRFDRVRGQGYRGWFRKADDEASNQELFTAVRDIVEASRSQTVRELIRVPGQDPDKRGIEYHILVYPLDEAESLWENANILNRMTGIVMPPRAMVELEDEDRGVYVAEAHPNDVTADIWMRDHQDTDTKETRHWLHQTATMLRKLHNFGFTLSELDPSDLWFCADGEVRIGAVEELAIGSPLGRDERKRRLLDISLDFEPPLPNRTRLRFLRSYLRGGFHGDENARFYLDDAGGRS